MGNSIAELKARYKHGDEFLAEMRERIGPRLIVAFSSGKDAVCMALRLKRHFEELIPFCCYYVPGLRIMDEALAYYEDKLFGGPIIRAPHPALIAWLNENRYQTPEDVQDVAKSALPAHISFLEIVEMIAEKHGLDPKPIYAVGSRAGEFFGRAVTVDKNRGGVWWSHRQFWPIWEMTKTEVLDEIKRAGLRLSREYDVWQTSFCGIDYAFMRELKAKEPDDWQRVLEWFPLIEAEIGRFERWDREHKGAA